jgi:hypothetical protein
MREREGSRGFPKRTKEDRGEIKEGGGKDGGDIQEGLRRDWVENKEVWRRD